MKNRNYIFLIGIFTILVSFNSFGQTDQDWKEIDSLNRYGQIKSALKKVQPIYEKTKRKKDYPNFLKALFLKTGIEKKLEEKDAQTKTLQRLEDEITNANAPIKAILQNAAAQSYQNYFVANSYAIRERSKIDIRPKDIGTWDAQTMEEHIIDLYLSSLEDKSTQKINLKEYDLVLIHQDNLDYNRWPTIYDLLAENAINFFKKENFHITNFQAKYDFSNPDLLGERAKFYKAAFPAENKKDPGFLALNTFKHLLQFHEKRKDKSAMIHHDLNRLKFVYEKSINENKEELYFNSLNKLYKENTSNELSTEVLFEMAQYFYKKKGEYNSDFYKEKQWDVKKAREYCMKAIESFPSSRGAQMCQTLRKRIDQKELSMKTEETIPVNKPSLGKIIYKNIDQVHFKILKADTREATKILGPGRLDEMKKYFASCPVVKQWSVPLTNPGDFRSHTTEIILPALETGHYILWSSYQADFGDKNNGMIFQRIYVSDISWIKADIGDAYVFYVVDRNTGHPLKNAKAELIHYERNYRTNTEKYNVTKEYTSDANGKIVIPKSKSGIRGQNRNTIRWSYKNDQIELGESYYMRKYDTVEKKRQHMYTFSDRKIYRPGQRIFFKGLLVEKFKKERKLLTNKNIQVNLVNPNRQVEKTIELTTNEYGSINGSFVLPTGGLNGNFYIEYKSNGYKATHSFSVEEYKRPKFEVTFLPIKKEYQLDDALEVQGSAKGLAGNAISGATVKYSVTRRSSFPSFPYWRYPYYQPRFPAREIASGTTTTDENGNFKIPFTLLPDKSITKNLNPNFSYSIQVDVTDITGETQSQNNRLYAAYKNRRLNAVAPENLDKSQILKYYVEAQNLSLNKVPAEISVVVYPLKNPEIAYSKRLWSPPDIYNIDEKTFRKNFPYAPYKRENLREFWPVEKAIANYTIDKNNTDTLEINVKKWKPGYYKFVASTKDKNGAEVTDEKYIIIYDIKSKTSPVNQILDVYSSHKKGEPGNSVRFDLFSSEKDLYILKEFVFEGKPAEADWLKVNQTNNFKFNIEEKHRGNVYFNFVTIRNNRFHQRTLPVYVPWTNKELKIELASWRNKMEPGSEEEWQVKISGEKGAKVTAEFLAGMYDASLDLHHTQNNWDINIYKKYFFNKFFNKSNSIERMSYSRNYNLSWNETNSYTYYLNQPAWDYNGLRFHGERYGGRGGIYPSTAPMTMDSAEEAAPGNWEKNGAIRNKSADVTEDIDEDGAENELDTEVIPTELKIRKNLDETVFFFPDLKTDADGNLILKFKMNEALTRWRFMALAHTKDLKIGSITKSVVTQKELMIQPNVPRFLREGDEIELSAKVSNMTDKNMSGEAELKIFDATTMQPVDDLLNNKNNIIKFNANPGGNAPLFWKLKIPFGKVNALSYQVIAKTNDFSDGEENTLPVVTNRMLVTETMPLPVRGQEKKDFTFRRMKETSGSNTLENHKYTLEFTSNPAWYAVQALPYLMEYPHECTEQLLNRYYANALGSHVANSHPKIQQVFKRWSEQDTDALVNNLAKNEELKSALLEETPWVLESMSETQQKKNIGLLFDLNKMGSELDAALSKLEQRQNADGSFSWFPGGRPNPYISQYVVERLGHLRKLGILKKSDKKVNRILNKAAQFADEEFTRFYNKLKERKQLNSNNLSSYVCHYFYARSFFPDRDITASTEAISYFRDQVEKYWMKQSDYNMGMIALAYHRLYPSSKVPNLIVKSLDERSLNNEELGMYWKYTNGYFWYQLPIETHALMIEVFDEVAQNEKAVDDLKVWLLKNKQTNHWKTTKATAAATYALLLKGDNWLLEDQAVKIKIGDSKPVVSTHPVLGDNEIYPKRMEAGTGYFKMDWKKTDITNDMANVQVDNPNKNPAWGAIYWQYFEDLDKITFFEDTPLKLKKELYIEKSTKTGPELSKVTEGQNIPIGEKVIVRIELRTDRDMEFLHLKDMRASGFEPINVISRYKWQDGFGYYESTKDLATHFFISYLPKGTYVFEYPLRATHKGDFSNGITTIQCMYAPEFTSHSQGVRVKME